MNIFNTIEELNEKSYEKLVKDLQDEQNWEYHLIDDVDGLPLALTKEYDKVKGYDPNMELITDFNPMRGVYDYIQVEEELLSSIIGDDEIVFGKWIIPNVMKYKRSAYLEYVPIFTMNKKTKEVDIAVRKGFNIAPPNNIPVFNLPPYYGFEQRIDYYEMVEQEIVAVYLFCKNTETKEHRIYKYKNKKYARVAL